MIHHRRNTILSIINAKSLNGKIHVNEEWMKHNLCRLDGKNVTQLRVKDFSLTTILTPLL
ncbi:unnamed protein product [Trichobilharzia regenti]|nr:unnamed protein product [Trichobilharzia regenti]